MVKWVRKAGRLVKKYAKQAINKNNIITKPLVVGGIKHALDYYKQPSRTKLKRRRKKQSRRIRRSTHNDMSINWFKVKPLGTKKIKTIGKFKYTEQKQGINSCLTGKQCVNDQFVMAGTLQLRGSTSNDVIDIDQWSTSPFLMNPYSTPANNAIYTLVAPAVADNDSIRLNHCMYRHELLNMENIPIEVEMTYYVAVTDTDQSPAVWWDTCLNEERYLQTVEAVAPGLIADTTATPGWRNVNSHGNRPEHCRNFKKCWRSIGDYKVVLQPGDQHIIKTKIQWNKTFYKKHLDSIITRWIKGVTIIPLMVARAGVVGVSGPAVATVVPDATEVSHGPVKVGFITSMDYEFAALPQNKQQIQRIFEGVIEPTGVRGGTGVNDYNLQVIGDDDRVILADEAQFIK